MAKQGVKVVLEDGSEVIPAYVWNTESNELEINADEEANQMVQKAIAEKTHEVMEGLIEAGLLEAINSAKEVLEDQINEAMEQRISEEVELLQETIDHYLHYAFTEINEDFENGDIATAIHGILAYLGIDWETARDHALAAAVDRGSAGSSWASNVPDSNALKNLASVKGQGQRAPATGNLGGGLKENVEVDPRVQKYVDYISDPQSYGSRLLRGSGKVVQFKRPMQLCEAQQEQLEKQRETAIEILENVTEGMSEAETQQFLSEVGNLEFDEKDPVKLQREVRQKRADQEAHDRLLQRFNAFENARAKGLICR
jgi:hypothetical protein